MTAHRRSVAGDALYARLLGVVWSRLPVEIRDMHQSAGRAEGRSTVERGTGILARLAALVLRLPKAAADTPISVQFDVSDSIETWTRTFGDEEFSSRQFAGHGRWAGLLCEQFGPFTFAMTLVLEGGRLSLALHHWTAFAIPLPMWLGPRAVAYETAQAGRFHFHVEISHPLTGLIVRYRGWLIRSPSSRRCRRSDA
jgi:hypothetical protein